MTDVATAGHDVTDPLVSCLMVTRNRARLAQRAIRCFAQQGWQNRELVIVDDGEEDYASVIAPYESSCQIRYFRLDPDASRCLGAMRNESLERAQGQFCIQWDDDEWYHPARIEQQLKVIEEGYDGSVLKQTLMHLDVAEFSEHPYRATLSRGTPGTILHRKSDVRYPNVSRGEDSVYLNGLRARLKIKILPLSHLFIRCFHGDNTWDRDHFLGQLRKRWRDELRYFFAARIAGDLLSHPAFRLSSTELEAVRLFLADSRALGLVNH